jgi:glycosyltransferase involved in cell wall biosynthesis
MRVAHIGNYKPDSPNGVDKTIAGLVRHLPAHGIEVEVWHPTASVTALRERREDGVLVFDMPVRRVFKGISRLGRAAHAFAVERARSTQLLHFHSVFQPENLVLSRLGLPYVVTPNGGYDSLVAGARNRFAKAFWMRLWERRFLAGARLIQAVSEPEAKSLAGFGLPTPIRYIPNGVDETAFRRPAPRPSRVSRYLFLGRLAIEQKGLDLLLQGYALAADRQRRLPELLLVGPDFRGGLAELKAMTERLGIADRVRFGAPVFGEAKWDLLAQSRLFIHCSRWEGMPFALLEALAMGRPVLATPGTNLAEAVRAHGAGLFVAPNPEAISEGLLEAATMPGVALDAMGEQARALARAKFGWHSIAGGLSESYRELLAA